MKDRKSGRVMECVEREGAQARVKGEKKAPRREADVSVFR